MDFGLNEDQETLARYAREFLTNEAPMSFVRKMMEGETAHDEGFYRKMAELGWMGIAIPEAHGGQGMTYVDLAVLLEEMGRAVVPGPFFATVCLAAPLIAAAGPDDQRQALLPGLASGEKTATIAYTEPSARLDASGIELAARSSNGAFVLNGTKSFVLDAHVADTLLVAARTSEGDDPSDGITLFVVDASSDGLSVSQLKAMDSTRRLCEVSFDGVRAAAVLGEVDRGWSQLERSLQVSAALLSAECVGGAHQVMDMSVEYARNRVQFGRPIGSFQAVKHKCADMLVDVEMARSAMYYAAWAASQDPASAGPSQDPASAGPSNEPSELPLAASMAKSYCSEAFLRVATNGIHVHGGIGFTWEHDMHIFFKRAKANEVLLGDPAYHRDLVARLVPA